jgi:hypothetical protein
MIDVTHYGLHRAPGNVAFLLQGNGATNALNLQLDCPFEVTLSRKTLRCPHNIILPRKEPEEWIEFRDFLLKDPLVHRMLPRPRTIEKPAFIVLDDKLILSQLIRLSSYTRSPILPVWACSPAKITHEMRVTNVQTMVFTDVQNNNRRDFQRLLELAILAPRHTVFVGEPDFIPPPDVERITTNVVLGTLERLPLEQLGAWYLKQEMLAS